MRFISVSKSVIIAIVVIAAIAVLYAKQRQNAGENTASPTVVSQTAGTPRLLDLGATQCVPCKMMQPVLAGLEKVYAGRLQVEFIDVWKDRAAGQKYGIEAIPTQICYDASGKEVFRHTGFFSKDQILAAFRNKGIALEARK
jgi:thioredoxin 1